MPGLSPLAARCGSGIPGGIPTAAGMPPLNPDEYADAGSRVGVLSTEAPDIRSLRETIVYGLRGIAAYGNPEITEVNIGVRRNDHFVGNYENAWWKQDREFDSFNGAMLMTTNCVVPVRSGYRDRIFTTGMAGYPILPIAWMDTRKISPR